MSKEKRVITGWIGKDDKIIRQYKGKNICNYWVEAFLLKDKPGKKFWENDCSLRKVRITIEEL